MRLYDIQNYPAGLFPDVAANGEDALLILQGDTRPFYSRGNGREGLFFYMGALAIKAFGIGVWQLYLPSIAVGIATVLAMYFAVRPYFGKRAGLFAALFLATSSWHIAISRTGFRAILVPLCIALFTAFVGYVVRSVKAKKIPDSYIYAAFAGAAFAGGFYTYIAYRAMIGVVVGIIILLLIASLHKKIGFPHVKRYGKQTLLALGVFVVCMLPLGIYFAQHPLEIVGRAGQVSVFNKQLQREFGGGTLLGTLGYTTSTTVLSFFTHGDINWRHNVSGYPLVNPLVGLLLVLGFLWMLKGAWDVLQTMKRGKEVHLGMIYPYVLLVLFGMMVPIITTAEGMPHALRSLGMLVPVYMMAGVAGAVTSRWLVTYCTKKKITGVAYGIIIGLLAVFAAYDISLYFIISRNSPEAYIAYRGDLTVVSAYINAYAKNNSASPKPYVVVDPYFAQTIHFLASSGEHDYLDLSQDALHKYRVLDPAAGDIPLVKMGEQIIFTQSTITDADTYGQRYQGALTNIGSQLNLFGEEVMRVYEGAVVDAPDDFPDLDA